MGIALVANRTREIRPSGMKTGAYGNVGVLGSKGKLRVSGIPLIKTRLGRGMRGITAGVKNKAASELLSIYCARRISIQRVAADKALISQVKVLPYQLPDSDT